MKKKQTMRKPKKTIAPKNCPYCANKTNPNFLDTKDLEKYVSERGKIFARTRTGLCSLHQRRMTIAVKHARHLALLPFVQRV